MDRDTLRRKKPMEDEHLVPEDAEQAERLEDARSAVAMARLVGDEDKVAEAKAALAAVVEEVKRDGIYFRIVSIGRARFEDMVRRHPPKEQGTDADFDPDTLWPELLAAAVEGDVTADGWRHDFLDSPAWGPGEVKALRDKVMNVHLANRVAELGN